MPVRRWDGRGWEAKAGGRTRANDEPTSPARPVSFLGRFYPQSPHSPYSLRIHWLALAFSLRLSRSSSSDPAAFGTMSSRRQSSSGPGGSFSRQILTSCSQAHSSMPVDPGSGSLRSGGCSPEGTCYYRYCILAAKGAQIHLWALFSTTIMRMYRRPDPPSHW